MNMYPYQTEAFTSCRNAFKNAKRVMLQMPTGAGKTKVALEIIKAAREKGKYVGFICDQIQLIEQASARFDSEGLDHSIIQADHPRYNPKLPVQVASIQTLSRRCLNGRIPLPPFDFIIIDEAHVLYKSHKKIMDTLNAVPVLGLSATPFSKGLGRTFESLVLGPSTEALIGGGYLVAPKVYAPDVPDLSGCRTKTTATGEKDYADTEAPMMGLVANVVDTWLSKGEDRPTLCFASSIKHSKSLVERFLRAGVPATHIDAYTDREGTRDAIQALERGDIKILSSVNKLAKGFDCPVASCAIVAAPTKSLTKHIQMLGRVVRGCPGKQDAIILDHAGNTLRLGFVTDPLPADLDTSEKGEKEKKEPGDKAKRCPQCDGAVPKGVMVCECGFEFKPVPVRSSEKPGVLQLIQGGKKMSDKQHVHAQLEWIANRRGYKQGWVSRTYRDIFGVWPRGIDIYRVEEPTPEVLSFVRSKHRRVAKSA